MLHTYLAAFPESFLIFALSILLVFGVLAWPLEGAPIGQRGTAWESLRNRRWSWRLSREGKLYHNTKESEGSFHGLLDGRGNFLRIGGLGIQSLLITAALCWGSQGMMEIGRFILDDFGSIVKIWILFSAAICLLMALYPSTPPYAFEFVLLLLLAVTGLLLLVSAYDLLALYLALELQSLSLYVLAALKRNSEFSTEAGLKYFILGAFSSGFLLFGSSLIYGFTGSTHFEDIFRLLSSLSYQPESLLWSNPGLFVGILFLLCGIFFKFGLVPFHMWTPDVYEGSPTTVTAFFAIVPKLAVLALCLRLFLSSFYGESFVLLLQPLIIFCAIASILIGTVAGLAQTKIKRLLAYSAISHMGYLFLAFLPGSIEGVQAIFVYMWIYILTSIGAFSFLLSLRRRDGSRMIYITDLAYLARSNPILALSFAILLFSMAGIPPLAGFFGKAYIFLSLIGDEFYLLAFIGVSLSVIGCFYYIRLVKLLYFRSEVSGPSPNWSMYLPIPKSQSYILAIIVIFLLFFVLAPNPLLLLAQKLALSFVL